VIYPGAVHPALTLLIYALAVARATVLVTEDRITEAPRTWALARLRERDWRPFRAVYRRYSASVEAQRAADWQDEEVNARVDAEAAELDALGKATEESAGTGYLSYLLTCPWCVSFWLALPAVVVWWNWPTSPWSLGPAILLAFSMITGKLSQIGG
jgi:hypothetical protein